MDDLDLEAAQAPEAAEPEPESAVQETVETEESDLPEIAPEWLVEGDPEPDNAPRGYQQQASWEQYQQSPPQQMQSPQPPQNKDFLESFVNDPHGTFQREVQKVAENIVAQMVGPMAYQVQATQQASQQFIRAQAQSAIQQTRKAIEGGYKEVLNKDEAFRGHKGVRARVENAMKGMYQEAAQAAARGDMSRLQQLSSPLMMESMLFMAKRLEGYPSKPTGEFSPRGASVESTKSKSKTKSVQIDADTESAIRDRLGSEYLERYRQALASGAAGIEFS